MLQAKGMCVWRDATWEKTVSCMHQPWDCVKHNSTYISHAKQLDANLLCVPWIVESAGRFSFAAAGANWAGILTGPCIPDVRRSSLGLLEIWLAAFSSYWFQKNPAEEHTRAGSPVGNEVEEREKKKKKKLALGHLINIDSLQYSDTVKKWDIWAVHILSYDLSGTSCFSLWWIKKCGRCGVYMSRGPRSH